MAIKKNIARQVIDYNSESDSNLMEKIFSKEKDSYFRTNVPSTPEVEEFSFDAEHVVSSGETLSEIASKYGLTYQEIADYNNITDPNYIEVGQTIKIPTVIPSETPTNNSSSNNSHTVSSGETLSEIASRYGLTYQELADYNNIADPNYIEVGQKIKIPTNINPEKNPNQQIAEDFKSFCQKTISSIGPLLEEKLKSVQNDTATAEAIVMDTLKEIGITLNEEVIKKIIDSKVKATSIATEIKKECEQGIEALTSLIPKITEYHQKNLDKAYDLKQLLSEALKNLSNLDLSKYLEPLRFAFFKSSSNTNYVINTSVKHQKEDIAIPLHGEVPYEGDFLYIKSPDCDLTFKIPLAHFEFEKEDKKSYKIVKLEGKDKEEYIRKAKQYVTDYLNRTKTFDYDFYETIKNSGLDKEIQIIYQKNGGYGGMTVNGKGIVINGNTIVYDDQDNRQVAQKILIHELGHAYDSTKGRISKTEEWQDIYSQIYKEEYSKLMSISMKGNKPNEWFARCVDNYYVYPERLTQIKIDYGKYNNLYDYMKDLLSGK